MSSAQFLRELCRHRCPNSNLRGRSSDLPWDTRARDDGSRPKLNCHDDFAWPNMHWPFDNPDPWPAVIAHPAWLFCPTAKAIHINHLNAGTFQYSRHDWPQATCTSWLLIGCFIMTGGSSADPASPHFADQVDGYAKHQFKEVLFYPEEVRKQAERTYHPGQ